MTKRRRYSDHPTGGWLLSSRDQVRSEDLEAHLKWVLDKIEPAADRVRTLQAEGNDVALICVVTGSPSGGGPTIGATTISRVANLRLPVDLDIYS